MSLYLMLILTLVLALLLIRDIPNWHFDVSPYIRVWLFLITLLLFEAIFEKKFNEINLFIILIGIFTIKTIMIILATFFEADICDFTNCIRLWPTELYRYANTYDVTIACLLVLIGRKYLMALPIVFFVSQTRLALLFSVIVYFRRINIKRFAQFSLFILIFYLGVNAFLTFQEVDMPRVLQLLDSSTSDKFEQYSEFFSNIGLHNIFLGEGLSVQLDGIEIRDVNRPYSYEAQLLALIQQGGLFFVIPLLLYILSITQSYLGLILYLIAGVLNPMMFVLSLTLILFFVRFEKVKTS